MNTLLIFLILSIPVILVSLRNLFNPRSHGFYRLLGWECLVWLLAANYRYWFAHPFKLHHLASWTLLLVATYVVLAGAVRLKKMGKAANTREDKSLFGFEKTTELVDSGIYSLIRHPLYGSLIFLTWAVFLKNPTLTLLAVAVPATVFFYITARFDEKECIAYFGEKYREYMTRSKMFVPYIF
jgi:protein-S-isoprenylcysteine O-methyltransferase Ste14